MTAPTDTPIEDRGEKVDVESRGWLARLNGRGVAREVAVRDLHALLLGAARFEVGRRRAALGHLRGNDFDDLAHQSADDALVAVLAKLSDYRGESRFTTWAYKFALLEAAVKLRRRAWQGREIPLEEEAWSRFSDRGASSQQSAEDSELLLALREEIEMKLSPRQREILVAVALNDVPIDVLADRLDTTRGALYKSLHDARRKLRAALAERGLSPTSDREEER